MNFTYPDTLTHAIWLPDHGWSTIMLILGGIGLFTMIASYAIGAGMGYGAMNRSEARTFTLIMLALVVVTSVGGFGTHRAVQAQEDAKNHALFTLVYEAERVYGITLSTDIARTLLADNSLDYMVAGGGDGMRQTLGKAHVVFDGDTTRIVNLRWMGDEWILVEGNQDDSVNNGDLPEFPREGV